MGDALRRAGYQAEPVDKAAGLDDVFYGMGEGLAEWVVTAHGGREMALQLSYFERGHAPVVMSVGPVLDLEDALGGKVCALASRAYERDFSDVAAALGRYSPEELIGFARRLDPGLDDEDFADAGRRLDQLSDRRLAEAGISDASAVRDRFASWPRETPGPDPGSARGSMA